MLLCDIGVWLCFLCVLFAIKTCANQLYDLHLTLHLTLLWNLQAQLWLLLTWSIIWCQIHCHSLRCIHSSDPLWRLAGRPQACALDHSAMMPCGLLLPSETGQPGRQCQVLPWQQTTNACLGARFAGVRPFSLQRLTSPTVHVANVWKARGGHNCAVPNKVIPIYVKDLLLLSKMKKL